MMAAPARPTARMASDEKRYTSIAPRKPPRKTFTFARSTESNGLPVSCATLSRYALNKRNAARAAEPTAYPLVRAFVVLPTASSRSVRSRVSSEARAIDATPRVVGDGAEGVFGEDECRAHEHAHRRDGRAVDATMRKTG